jgi:hypothetical protein
MDTAVVIVAYVFSNSEAYFYVALSYKIKFINTETILTNVGLNIDEKLLSV